MANEKRNRPGGFGTKRLRPVEDKAKKKSEDKAEKKD